MSTAIPTTITTAATPLPLRQVSIVAMVIFADAFGTYVIFPFLPFVIQHFSPGLRTEDVGSRAGILAASYHVGSLLASMVWGRLADVHGRRPVMLSGLFGTLLCILGFAFSPSFSMAVSARFLWGLLNGNVGVAKSYLSEILDDSNMAKGFSSMGIASGFGRLFGPLCGAVLYNPAVNIPNVFGRFPVLVAFPQMLPSLVGAAVCLVGWVFAYFTLEETLRKDKRDKRFSPAPESLQQQQQQRGQATGVGAAMSSRNWDDDQTSVYVDRAGEAQEQSRRLLDDYESQQQQRQDINLPAPDRRLNLHEQVLQRLDQDRSGAPSDTVLPTHTGDNNSSSSSNSSNNAPRTERMPWEVRRSTRGGIAFLLCLPVRWACAMVRRTVGPMRTVLQAQAVWVACSLYGILALCATTAQEIFSLWTITDPHHGGFSLAAEHIGFVLGWAAPLQIVAQVVLFPRLTSHLGFRRLMQYSLIVTAIVFSTIPFASLFSQPGPSTLPGIIADSLALPPPLPQQQQPHHHLSAAIANASGLLLQPPPPAAAARLPRSASTTNNDSTLHVHIAAEDPVFRMHGQQRVAVTRFIMGLLVCCYSSMQLTTVTAFSAVMVLINNSCSAAERGTVNGLGQSMASLGRMIGPAIGGVAFAWSENNGFGWPFDFHFVWHCISMVALGAYCLSRLLPLSIDKKPEN
eukprot:m.126810 g.126810  ORF g.126810 m.126810 type:complete len:686 (-) comp16347_c1_seq7:1199-3256(-)